MKTQQQVLPVVNWAFNILHTKFENGVPLNLDMDLLDRQDMPLQVMQVIRTTCNDEIKDKSFKLLLYKEYQDRSLVKMLLRPKQLNESTLLELFLKQHLFQCDLLRAMELLHVEHFEIVETKLVPLLGDADLSSHIVERLFKLCCVWVNQNPAYVARVPTNFCYDEDDTATVNFVMNCLKKWYAMCARAGCLLQWFETAVRVADIISADFETDLDLLKIVQPSDCKTFQNYNCMLQVLDYMERRDLHVSIVRDAETKLHVKNLLLYVTQAFAHSILGPF